MIIRTELLQDSCAKILNAVDQHTMDDEFDIRLLITFLLFATAKVEYKRF